MNNLIGEMKSLTLLLLVSVGVSGTNCENTETSCNYAKVCLPQEFVCDSVRHCSDSSDEDPELCDAWKNSKCERNYVECTRNGETNCVEISKYCTLDNPPCEGELDLRICLMLVSGKLDKLSNFSLQTTDHKKPILPVTIPHNEPPCPGLFILVGDQCLLFFYVGSMSWAEGRAFCNFMNGDLLTMKNVSHFTVIVQRLQSYDIPSDLWIGGSIENTAVGWTWVDDSPMQMGSPFWAKRYNPNCLTRNGTAKSETICNYQTPEVEPMGECASLSFQHSFYITDEDCLKKKSPLCVYQGSDYPKIPKL